MRADDVEIGGQHFEEEALRKLLDGEHVDEQCAPLQPLERQREEDLLGGDYRGAEEDYFWMLLAEIVGVWEERDAEILSGVGVVGAGMG